MNESICPSCGQNKEISLKLTLLLAFLIACISSTFFMFKWLDARTELKQLKEFKNEMV